MQCTIFSKCTIYHNHVKKYHKHDQLKNFREINSLVTSLVQTSIWRKNADFA